MENILDTTTANMIIEGVFLDPDFTKLWKHKNYCHSQHYKNTCELCTDNSDDITILYAINIIQTNCTFNKKCILVLSENDYHKLIDSTTYNIYETIMLEDHWFHIETNTKSNKNSVIYMNDFDNTMLVKHYFELKQFYKDNKITNTLNKYLM